MKKQDMANLIFEMLGGILSETNFRLKKSESCFVKKIPEGRQMLGLPLWDYRPEFQFSLNICIRLDAVEDIFHKFSGSSDHSASFTTMARLEYFTGGSAKYKVTTAEEVTSAGVGLASVIRDKILPFFDENEDVKALDRTVNAKYPGIDITQYPWRAMHAVILAHLAGNADFESLVVKYRNEMQLASETAHPFNQVVQYLKAHSRQ